MAPMSMWDMEEDRLVEAVNSGEISDAEFRKEMRSLRDEFREQAEMAAQEAYDNAMNRW